MSTTGNNAKKARWRKQPRETGLRSIGSGPRGYELRIGDEVIIHVSAYGGGWSQPLRGWYWYGMDRNTSTEKLFATAEEAKAAADAFYKANK